MPSATTSQSDVVHQSVEQYWRGKAKRSRAKINCGWFLQAISTPLLICSLVLGCLALFARGHWPAETERVLPWVLSVFLLLLPALGYFVARRKFITFQDAIVGLDAAHGMHNALYMAHQNRAPWPAIPEKPLSSATRWHHANCLFPPLAALAFLAAGIFLPVQAPRLPATPEEPTAWKQTESEIQSLIEKKAVDPESARESLEAIEQLRTQKTQDWFSHSSLEATDKMRDTHQSAMASLEKNLRQSTAAAESLAIDPALLSPSAKNFGKEQLQQALQAMRQGALKPNADLLGKLTELDPQQLGKLNRMQIDELLANINEAADALAEAQGKGNPEHKENDLAGENPGEGGVERGPGTSDDVFGEDSLQLNPNKNSPLRPRDLSRSAPGDLLQSEAIPHDIDTSPTAPRSGGAADSAGGGASSWQDSLHPSEQEALKRFFE